MPYEFSSRVFLQLLFLLGLPFSNVYAQTSKDLASALIFHASFDHGLDADYSRGDKSCSMKQGKNLVPAVLNDEMRIVPHGRFGSGLHFLKKGTTRPQFKGDGMLGYNDRSWSASVSVWFKLDPDKDLEAGYCDPVQIIGEDTKKGFIFLEWSKDESPRHFRFAIRPLLQNWNPNNVDWAKLTPEQRPAVNLERAPFSREAWTHVIFTFENLNDKTKKPIGRLYLNGEPKGAIENWDLTLGWDPAQVFLVLGASYVGHLDDLAAFNRGLSDDEVKAIYAFKQGIRELLP
jgi:Concanavalin A-like lectin/glucanases superfamily